MSPYCFEPEGELQGTPEKLRSLQISTYLVVYDILKSPYPMLFLLDLVYMGEIGAAE